MQEYHPEIRSKDLWDEWNKTWGFLKHAKNGIEQRTIDEDLIENILFAAMHDFQSLPEKLNEPEISKNSIEMEVYQLWFYAKNEGIFPCDHEVTLLTKERFPSITTLNRNDQINLGRQVLLEENCP